MVKLASLLWATLIVAGCAVSTATREDSPAGAPGPAAFRSVPPNEAQPEGATGVSAKSFPAARRHAVVAAHPLATRAGLSMLQEGGSAMDAAIATALVLGVVEPQSSGIGGGAFLMAYDGVRSIAYDGRETAPADVDESLFLQPDGRPMPFTAAVVGGRSVGVPGALRMFELAHRVHGKLPWSKLFQPAIELADSGFEIGPRLHELLASDQWLRHEPAAAAYFYRPDGTPWPVGARLRNPALAHVLRQVAADGADVFYKGAVAEAIVAKVRGHVRNPGVLGLADLAGYQALARPALCSAWQPAQVTLRLCGFPPPSSGAIAIGQILGIMQRLSPAQQQIARSLPTGRPGSTDPELLPTATTLHRYTEAARLAFADRAAYIGDPAFVQAPAGRWDSLLDDAYLRQRAALIGPRSMKIARPGKPSGVVLATTPDRSPEFPSTSHLSVVDSSGQAVALTTTIENQFGSRLLVSPLGLPGGFLLNNELTDFSFVPREDGVAVANRVQPGKRPRSSMSPTFVFDATSGKLLSVGGSAGGPLIIHHTAKVLLATMLWNLSPQQGVAMPNFASMNGPTLLEVGRFPAATLDILRRLGHDLRETEVTSGLHWLSRTLVDSPAGPELGPWEGGVDPRREGAMSGE
jgi:gamma-glutamyltranspeptidase/glutathione hydrolase